MKGDTGRYRPCNHAGSIDYVIIIELPCIIVSQHTCMRKSLVFVRNHSVINICGCSSVLPPVCTKTILLLVYTALLQTKLCKSSRGDVFACRYNNIIIISNSYYKRHIRCMPKLHKWAMKLLAMSNGVIKSYPVGFVLRL